MSTIKFGPVNCAHPFLAIRIMNDDESVALYNAVIEPVENRFVITKRDTDTTFGHSPIVHYKQLFKRKNLEEIDKLVFGQFALAINNMISTLSDLLGLTILTPILTNRENADIEQFIEASTKYFMSSSRS